MNRRNLFRSLASIALVPLTPALAWANTQHDKLMEQARALDGAKGWPKLREIHPPLGTKRLTHAVMRDELHAMVNALDEDQSWFAITALAEIRMPAAEMSEKRAQWEFEPRQSRVIE